MSDKEFKAMVDEWLSTQEVSKRCKNVYRDSLITMFKQGRHPGDGSYAAYKGFFDEVKLSD